MSQRRGIRVSDHALLRWLERAGVLEVESVRAMLQASLDQAYAAGASLGAARFTIVADGLLYLVRGDTLVTVMADKGIGSRVRAASPPRGHGALGEP